MRDGPGQRKRRKERADRGGRREREREEEDRARRNNSASRLDDVSVQTCARTPALTSKSGDTADALEARETDRKGSKRG